MKKLILVSVLSAIFASQAQAGMNNDDMVEVVLVHKSFATEQAPVQFSAQRANVRSQTMTTQSNMARTIQNETEERCVDVAQNGAQWCLPVRKSDVQLDSFSTMNMSDNKTRIQNQLMNVQRVRLDRHGLSDREILQIIHDTGAYARVEIPGKVRPFGYTVQDVDLSTVRSQVDYTERDRQVNGYEYELFSDFSWEQQGWALFSTSHQPMASNIASVMAREDEGSQERFPIFVMDGSGFEVSSEVPYAVGRNFFHGEDYLDITPRGSDGVSVQGCNGHGLGVASTIAGTRNQGYVAGIAKNADIYALRMLNCSTSADVAEVLLWLSGDLYERRALEGWAVSQPDDYEGAPGVVNMSFGGYNTSAIDETGTYVLEDCGMWLQLGIDAAIESGFILVAAAGNDNVHGWNTSPAGCPGVITVGALVNHDGKKADFSNWGKQVDVFAPGDAIHAMGGVGDNMGLMQWRGTSFAAPIVSGLIAETSRHVDLSDIDVGELLRFTAYDPTLGSPEPCEGEPSFQADGHCFSGGGEGYDNYSTDPFPGCIDGMCGAGRVDGEAFFLAAKAHGEGNLHRITPALAGLSEEQQAWYAEHFGNFEEMQGSYKLEFFNGHSQRDHYFKLAESFKGDDFKRGSYHTVGEFRSGVEFTNAIDPLGSDYAFQVCTDSEGCSGEWRVMNASTAQ